LRFQKSSTFILSGKVITIPICHWLEKLTKAEKCISNKNLSIWYCLCLSTVLYWLSLSPHDLRMIVQGFLFVLIYRWLWWAGGE